MKKLNDKYYLFLFVCILVMVIFEVICSDAKSEEIEPTDLGLLLAQTCAAEVGINNSTNECFLIWEINARNAKKRNRTIEDQTLAFNAYWKRSPKKRKRKWIAFLNRECEQPEHWPRAQHWDEDKNAWREYLVAVDHFLSDLKSQIYEARCPRASDYGAPGIDTPNDLCARVIKCYNGRTRMRYWDLRGCWR